MSQKYIKRKNKNSYNAAYGKYYATAVYDNHFIGTEELADFIQSQASVKKSDIKAVLDELGAAMKHYFELGQKVRLDGIGIMKVGFSSIGVNKVEDCTSATITTRRVLFQPETERVVVGQEKKPDGSVKQKYVNAITLLKDVVFEETHDNTMNMEPEDDEQSGGSQGGSENQGGSNGGTSQGGGTGTINTGGGSTGGENNDGTGGGSQSETVAAPTINGNTSFAESTQVTMSGPEGAEIHYTTDGSTPTSESTLYSEAFSLSATTTVKAIAIKDGVSSEVTSKTFTKSTGGDDSE